LGIFVVREEIKRIKAVEPKMTHKEAFSEVFYGTFK
jgi:hypothetical protein